MRRDYTLSDRLSDLWGRLARRGRRPGGAPTRRSRLGVETLEGRDVPAGVWIGDPGHVPGAAYQAGALPAAGTVVLHGGTERLNDVDLIAVDLRAGQRVSIGIDDTWDHHRGGLRASMRVFDPLGRARWGGPHQNRLGGFTVEFNAPLDGRYHVGVSAAGNDGYDLHGTGVRDTPSSNPAAIGGYTVSMWAPSQSPAPIAWGNRVSPAFANRVRGIAAGLGIDPSWLMSVMAFESLETFSPSVRNGAGSGAVGLIQFMPDTARSLGTTTAALSRMTAVQQLDYVERYFAPYRGRLPSLDDTYMAVLRPSAIGRASNYVLFQQGTLAYAQNAGLDANHDGSITKFEAVSRVRAALARGLLPGYVG